MVWLWVVIIVFIAIILSSASSRNKPHTMAATDSEENNNHRAKRTAADNESTQRVQHDAYHINTFHRMIKEQSQNNLNICMELEHKIDACMATLTQHISSIGEQILHHTLATMACRLRVSSQSFGEKYRNQNKENTLDRFNSRLYDISRYDICALQNLNVPQSRWDQKRVGVTEIFKPILEKRGHYLILRSFDHVERRTKDQEICYAAFGFYINPCFNFQFNIDTGVETILTDNGVGTLLIHGTLFDKYKAIFACVRGFFDETQDHYSNAENITIINRTIDRIVAINPHFYTIIGDFKLRHSVFADAMTSVWRNTLPDMQCESDVLSSGSLLSSFDQYGYAQPDHILTNMHMIDFRLFHALPIDRMRIETILYPLEQTARQTMHANTPRIRKLNVPLRQDKIKF